jgi:hypothetical protein
MTSGSGVQLMFFPWMHAKFLTNADILFYQEAICACWGKSKFELKFSIYESFHRCSLLFGSHFHLQLVTLLVSSGGMVPELPW